MKAKNTNMNEFFIDKRIEIFNYKIENYINVIEKYFQLWLFSNYEIPVKPIRNVINLDKQITKIILSQGSVIELNPKIYFKITEKNSDNNDYKINKIPNTDFNERVLSIKPKLYETIFLDKRITFIKHITYKKKIYNKVKQTISTFLQIPENLNLKLYLKEHLDYQGKTITHKRKELYPLINKIFNLIFISKLITQEDFDRSSLELRRQQCSNILESDKCNDVNYCSNKQIQVSQKYTNIDIFKLIYRLDTNEKQVFTNKKLLNRKLQSLSLEIKSNNNLNIETYWKHLFDKYITKKSNNEFITNLTKIINNIPNNTNFSKCRLIIYTIVPSSDLKNDVYSDNYLYKTFLYRFLEEIIRNRYKRQQIIDNIKILNNYEKYIVNKPFEIMFT